MTSKKLRTLPLLGTALAWLSMAVAMVVTTPAAWARPVDLDNPALGGEHGLDEPMMHDPELADAMRQLSFAPRLLELWTGVLTNPAEPVDAKRTAAQAITRAQQMGMAGLETASPVLAQLAAVKDQHPVLLQASLAALIALNADEHAALLLEHNRSNDVDVVLLTDPALARWKTGAAQDLWLKRLDDREAFEAIRTSAMRSLAATNATTAVESLARIVIDTENSPTLRLAAAQTLGTLAKSDLTTQARQLGQGDALDQLLAAAMLQSHSGKGDVEVLSSLATNAAPPAAALALERLLAINARDITPEMSAKLVTSPDANVRLWIARARAAHETPDGVAMLGRMLDDRDPTTRMFAREALIQLAQKPSLRQPVEQAITTALASSDTQQWRGLEQAGYVAGALDMEATAPRLMELMRFERSEVRLAMLVGLRRLALPDTLPTLLARAQEITGQLGTPATDSSSTSTQQEAELAQIFQTFGLMKFAPAEGLAMGYVPKSMKNPPEARAAAIWYLSHLHENEGGHRLAGMFVSRLSDLNPMDPEHMIVRRMSAVGLGRLKAKSGLGALNRFLKEENSSGDIGGACRWAIMRITGEDLPPLDTVIEDQRGWFLEPLGER